MKAWLMTRYGDLDELTLDEIPELQPAPGEAVIQLEYAAINPADRFLLQRQYPAKPKFPHILGRDGAGRVVELGSETQGISIGQQAMILRSEIGVNRPGTLAQRVAVPVESLTPVPDGWTIEQAGAGTLVYLTAFQAMSIWPDLPEKPLLLISGASGGVGVAALQLATSKGWQVIALSRSKEKQEMLKKLGAWEAVDPGTGGWVESLKQKLGNQRVDLAIDNVAGQQFNNLINLMGDNGRISVVGRSGGAVPEFNTASLFFRRIKIGGVAVGVYTPAQSRAAWQQVVAMLGKNRPIIDSVWKFDQLKSAFEKLAAGPMGKVLVQVA